MYNVTYLKNNGVDVDSSLELFGTIDIYNDTVGEFLISAKEKLEKLEEYKNRKDLANYAIYAHSLKSDARYFGFTQLGELAYNHEIKSKEGDFFYVYNNYAELAAETTKAINILNTYLSGNAPSTVDAEMPVGVAANEAINVAPAETVPVVTNDFSNVAAVSVPVQENQVSEDLHYYKKTILVVDDSNIVRNFVKRIFSDSYDVGTAKNGQEAIDILNANKGNENLAAILLDLNMPIVDGFAVLDYIRDNALEASVSIISGDSSKETIDRAFKYQIVDMLSKPFNDADIKRVVERTISYRDLI